MRKLLLFLCLIFGTLGISAQTTVQIGSGTTSTSYFPNYYLYDFSFSQSIYLGSEITSAGAPAPGFIHKIRYLPGSSVSTAMWRDWVIYMGNTNKTGFTGTSDYVTGLTEVFNGQIPANTVNGQWIEITLTTPFLWDGTSNIVIAVDENTADWGNSPSWRGFSANASSGEYRGIYFYQDNTNIDPLNPSATYSGTSNSIAQIQFDMGGASACSDSPSAGTLIGDTAVCPSKSFTIVATNSSSGTGIIYEWESSIAGLNAWSPETSTSTSLTISSGITQDMDYRFKITCTNSGQTTYSQVFSVTVNPPTNCYCIPSGSDNSDAIAAFKLDTLNHITNGNSPSGYGNYTSKVIGLSQGLTYTAEVTAYTGTGDHGVAIWIDYNNDGIFDVSERLGTADNIQPGQTASISFTVDPSATLGLHRLRVMYQYAKAGDAIDPCVGVTFGETEDYTVEIKVPPACAAPTAIQHNNVTNNSAQISWQPPLIGSPLSYDVYYSTSPIRPADTAAATISGINNFFVDITPLSENTSYYVWLRTFCGGTSYSEWSMRDSFKTTCSPQNLPVTEGFEGSGNIPDCWAQQFVNGNNPFRFGNETTAGVNTPNPPAFNGNHRLFFHSYSNTGTQTRLVSPPINTTTLTTSVDVSFYWYFSSSGTATSYLTEGVQLQVSTDGVTWTDEGDFIRRYGPVTGWEKQKITLNSVMGLPIVYVGFLFTSNAGYNSLMDSITIAETPTCNEPTDIVVSNITNNSAQVDWDVPLIGSPISYDIYYSKSSSHPDSSTIPSKTNIPTNSDLITGLDAATTYYIWVRTFCGGTDYSGWSNIDSFITHCDPITVLPWMEDFESSATGNSVLPDCWDYETSVGANSTMGVTNTNDSYRGPRTGSKYVSTRYSSTHWIYTPGFELTAGESYDFSFYMMNKNGSSGFTVDVAYGNNPSEADMVNNMATIIDPSNKNYVQFKYTVTIPVTGVYYFGIKSTANGTPWYLSFDDFMLQETPSCTPPSNITATNITTTSAQLDWTSPVVGTPLSYDIYYNTNGAAPNSTTTPILTGITGNNTNITSLLPSTTYNVWIRTNCVSGLSLWSEKFMFPTVCGIIDSFPFTEGFNSAQISPCWTQEYVSGTQTWKAVTENGTGNITPKSGSHMAEFRVASFAADKTKLVSPMLNLSSLTAPELTFWLANEAWSGDIDELRLYYKNSPTGSWTQFGPTITNEHTTWTEYSVALPNPSATYYIAFEATSQYARGLNIDDIMVSENSTVPVVLASFKGEKAGEVNKLFWNTASENNNKGFEVQRSVDGKEFEPIGFVNTASEGGVSATSLNYTFIDEKPFVDGNYYRLKQVDMDGKSQLSNVIFIKGDEFVKLNISNLYPNPARSKVTLKMEVPSTDKINIVISDVSGRVVSSITKTVHAGVNTIDLNVGQLIPGTYLLKVICTDGCESAVKKFIKE